MNNIVWLSPFWTAVFGLAFITFIIAFNWNNIQKAVKERIGDQSLKDFLSTNLWVVIPRIIIALGAYIYVANMCGFFAITTGIVVSILCLLVFMILGMETYVLDDTGFEGVKCFFFYAIMLSIFASSILAFIFADTSTALISLCCTVFAGIVIPKYKLKHKTEKIHW